MYLCMDVWIDVCICIYICMCIHNSNTESPRRAFLGIYMYLCMDVWIDVYICIYMYVYTYKFKY
jgi:hypothetical protein